MHRFPLPFVAAISIALFIIVGTAAMAGCGELDGEPRPVVTNVPAENTPILCDDGIDNDGDGYIDCNDDECRDPGLENDPECLQKPCPGRVVCLSTEDTDALCTDGVDNDGNGFIDCGDFSCARSQYVTVCCSATAEVEDTDALCNDGIDNDCNGYTDCDDRSCSESELVTVCSMPTPETPENTEEACSDGEDNDHDGRVDCADWDCDPENAESVFPYCLDKEPEDTEAVCDDGIDNDRDGQLDCQDWICWDSFPVLCGWAEAE